ncbi:hypothetical protein Tco_0807988 [Tanacetum coccineum]
MESNSVLINSSRPLPRDEQEWTHLTDLTYEAKEESQRRQRSWQKHGNKEFESGNIHRMQQMLHVVNILDWGDLMTYSMSNRPLGLDSTNQMWTLALIGDFVKTSVIHLHLPSIALLLDDIAWSPAWVSTFMTIHLPSAIEQFLPSMLASGLALAVASYEQLARLEVLSLITGHFGRQTAWLCSLVMALSLSKTFGSCLHDSTAFLLRALHFFYLAALYKASLLVFIVATPFAVGNLIIQWMVEHTAPRLLMPVLPIIAL